MKEQVNTIDWLERQLAQVNTFIERDTALLKEDPDDFAVELSLNSWKFERESLEDELRLARRELVPNSLEIFFAQDDGLSLSSKEIDDAFQILIDDLIKAISLADHFRSTGRGPNKGRGKTLDKDLLFSYKRKDNENEKFILFEKTKRETSVLGPFECAILGILNTLNADTYHKLFENFLTIGLDCAIQLRDMLAALDRRGLSPRFAWASHDHALFWHGDVQHSIKSFERLSVVENIKTRSFLLTGSIIRRDESGILMKVKNHNGLLRVFCSDIQHHKISNPDESKIISIEVVEYDLYISNETERLIALHAVI
ncbi:hypothetical protein CQ009_13030 [Pseudomonas sp. MYb2]|uniref:hypothetical protein n=1 Tax=unclassified Pseudomonas TaxID=196821 RepID=UPI000D001EBC|nr:MULTISPECIES: hypothetical protein [unclassified Pseudomonas]PRB51200.1 hypothetical protein CQ025_09675 [Pseudomonas sp. MYb3]PRC34579.1 hypothetical protein CQ009_13030 [Pseudomonas sp. MYb2]